MSLYNPNYYLSTRNCHVISKWFINYVLSSIYAGLRIRSHGWLREVDFRSRFSNKKLTGSRNFFFNFNKSREPIKSKLPYVDEELQSNGLDVRNKKLVGPAKQTLLKQHCKNISGTLLDFRRVNKPKKKKEQRKKNFSNRARWLIQILGGRNIIDCKTLSY